MVLMGVVMILISMLMPAVGAARAAARRMMCSKQARELALATTMYHDAYRALPPGTELGESRRPWQAWYAKVLPYLEMQSIYLEIESAYEASANPFRSEVHKHLATPIYAFACPEDSRTMTSQLSGRHGYYVGTTGFQGNAGTNSDAMDGVLYGASSVRFADVHDGLSQTLLFGERPPSAWADLGWWYAGVGTGRGGLDHTLGTAETHVPRYGMCSAATAPFKFQNGNIRNDCDASHFWSLHPGGGHFARCDGSVAFHSYAGADVLIPLSTRDTGEIER
jgi:hypothetical protein